MKEISTPCGISAPLAKNALIVKGTLYGSRSEVTKLKKRILCASRRLGIHWQFTIETDLLKAADVGATNLPILVVNDNILIQGLLATEEIESFLKRKLII